MRWEPEPSKENAKQLFNFPIVYYSESDRNCEIRNMQLSMWRGM